MQSVWASKNDYERRARLVCSSFFIRPTASPVPQLLSALSEIQNRWSASQFTGTYADAKDHSSDFLSYKQSKKRIWVAEKQDLATLFGNVQTKLKTYSLKDYVPPAGLALSVNAADDHSWIYLPSAGQDLDDAWKVLLASEAKRSRAINAQIREYALV
jgi:cofilin